MLYYRQYIDDHSKPWVTFIHGAGGNSNTFFKQIKEFRKHFNVLLIDLRGHGKSTKSIWKKGDSFTQISEDIIEVLNHLKIIETHFVGVSLGTVIVQTLAQKYPKRISSMILGGAIIKFNIRTNLLLTLGNLGKYFIPYMWLYRLFAWIIMPKPAHAISRNVFVDQAKQMCQKEFIRWFSVTRAINPFLKMLQKDFFNIPTMFVMGEEDYLFLPPVKDLVEQNNKLALKCIKNSGHVCNIDQPEIFNVASITFIRQQNQLKEVL